MPPSSSVRAARRPRVVRHAAVARRRIARLDPTLHALAWAMAAGLLFVVLNTSMRLLAISLNPFQTLFLRYVMGVLVMAPLVWRAGLASYRPQNVTGQFARGLVHTIALTLWFVALPHVTVADTTAIGFTTPLFIMLGAVLVFREKMRWERWFAAGLGFAGVLVVVGPKLNLAGGNYALVMLLGAPVFAASFLMSKALTRYERSEVIVVWQSIAVTLFSLPLALTVWETPTPAHWLLLAACGLVGTAAQYCLTQSFAKADMSASQSVKFLELVWAALAGWVVFGDAPTQSTMIGGAIICAATVWITQREARRGR